MSQDFGILFFRLEILVSRHETCGSFARATLIVILIFFACRLCVVTHSSEVSGTLIVSRVTATNSFFSSSYQFLAQHLSDSVKLAFVARRSYW
jgi:hypothetical protein